MRPFAATATDTKAMTCELGDQPPAAEAAMSGNEEYDSADISTVQRELDALAGAYRSAIFHDHQ